MNTMSMLSGDWVHAHEDDKPGERVFRRAGVPMPPSRGREKLSLRGDGTALQTGPGPDDRTVTEPVKWSLDQNTIVLQPAAGDSESRYEIVKLEPDRLVLRTPF